MKIKTKIILDAEIELTETENLIEVSYNFKTTGLVIRKVLIDNGVHPARLARSNGYKCVKFPFAFYPNAE